MWFKSFSKYVLLSFAAAGTIGTTACGISTQQEAQMGAQYASEINRQLPIISDATAHGYINQLGDRLGRFGRRGFNYTFFIVNADMVNAFAVPGGYIYVNRGLIQDADNIAELAGVLAHEIGHVEHRHGAEQMERMQRAQLGLSLGYILLGRAPSGVERAAIDVGGSLYFARHSREAENEADEAAVPLLLAARIDPHGLVTMFEELLQDQRSQPNRLQQWFSTHPTTQERINHTKGIISRVPANQLRNLTIDEQGFRNFKARLAQLPAPPAQYRIAR
jgi:predicted Zn-dependent protease